MEITTIKLDDGRELGIAPVEPHEAMNLAERCRELSGNRRWWRTAMIVAAIRTIDGIPNPFPTHKKHIQGLVGRFEKSDIDLLREPSATWPETTAVHELEFSALTTLEDLNVSEIAEDCSDVPGWIGPAMLAATVRKIDGESVAFPKSHDEMLDLVKRLGQAGLVKAAAYMFENVEQEKASAEAKKAAAKN